MGLVNIMDTFIILHIIITYLVILTECKRKPIFRDIFIPYDRILCRQLCEGSNDTFLYKDDLSCHWIPGHDVQRIKLISARHVKAKIRTGSMSDTVVAALDICCQHPTVTGGDVVLFGVEMSTSALSSKDLRQLQAGYVKALHQACAGGNLEMVKCILSKGLTDINCRGLSEQTPIMVAAEKGHINVFDYLLSQGSDLAPVDIYSNNVLHLACEGGNTDIVRKLVVNQKYDIECKGKYDQTPVLVAVLKGHENVFDFLVKQGCNLLVVNKHSYNLLHMACIGGNVKIVRKILRFKSFDMEERGRHGTTPVMTAVLKGKDSVFQFLVSQGCNMLPVASANMNVLHYACCGGNVDIVKYLVIKEKFDIETKNLYWKQTPVMMAAERGKVGVVEFLVKEGCNLDDADNKGNTILHLACRTGKVDVVKYLISLKAVRGMGKVKNKRGQTPIQVAKRHAKVVSLLTAMKPF